jgi:hypothetical protein
MGADHFTPNRFEPRASILHGDLLVPRFPHRSITQSGAMEVEAGFNFEFYKFIRREILCTTRKASVSLFDSIPRHSAGSSLGLLVGRLVLDPGEEGSGIFVY